MIDALMLLGENRFGPTLPADEAIRLADELGLEAIVAAPARPLDYHLGPANEALARLASGSGARIVALGRIDPLDGRRAVREAERCLGELGCAGLFLHPGEEAYPVRAAWPIVEVAARLAVPVVVATGFFSLSEPLQIAELANRSPETPIVMTNGGQINISGLSMVDAWLALTTTPNLHVLTNGEYRQDFIERLASEWDQRRVLYASFAPVFDAAFEQARIRSAGLSEGARQAIEHDNAARLFQRGTIASCLRLRRVVGGLRAAPWRDRDDLATRRRADAFAHDPLRPVSRATASLSASGPPTLPGNTA